MENEGGFIGWVFYAGCCILMGGMILTALDGVGDKGYKSGYVKMVGPSLVLFGLVLVLIRIGYIFIKSFKRTKKPTKKIVENKKDVTKERKSDIEIIVTKPCPITSENSIFDEKRRMLDLINNL